jgi:hypothetical protein
VKLATRGIDPRHLGRCAGDGSGELLGEADCTRRRTLVLTCGDAGHGNTNKRHQGARHLLAVLLRVFLATERWRTAAPEQRRS